MVKLLIIADDFTGALDTGIQFAKRGICTQILIQQKLESKDIKPDTEVLVVDTESRPMSKELAYEAVYNIADWAVRQGIGIIFKKTDSALRGNIGTELQAIADIDGTEPLFFLPGYPEIERVTKNGVHFISGELLENSVFRNDPFEPVEKSYIPDIIKEQSDIPVVCIKNNESVKKYEKKTFRIIICDVESTEDIDRRLDELIYLDRLKLIAGCAALADRLAERIPFHYVERKKIRKTENMYVACGSLNRITQEQVEYAEQKCGFIRKNLTIEQKLEPNYYKTQEGKMFLEEILKLCQRGKRVIVDTFDTNENKKYYLQNRNMSSDEVRLLVAEAHGHIVKEIVNHQLDITILMTGGDTLMGYMKLVDCTQIEPVCEIDQGVVVSLLEWNGYQQQIISKSGGFGTKDILSKIEKLIIK